MQVPRLSLDRVERIGRESGLRCSSDGRMVCRRKRSRNDQAIIHIPRWADAHAAASPDQGLNALDAAVQFYLQVRMMRTLVRRGKDVIISAVIRDGGVAPNIISAGRRSGWISERTIPDT